MVLLYTIDPNFVANGVEKIILLKGTIQVQFRLSVTHISPDRQLNCMRHLRTGNSSSIISSTLHVEGLERNIWDSFGCDYLNKIFVSDEDAH